MTVGMAVISFELIEKPFLVFKNFFRLFRRGPYNKGNFAEQTSTITAS